MIKRRVCMIGLLFWLGSIFVSAIVSLFSDMFAVWIFGLSRPGIWTVVERLTDPDGMRTVMTALGAVCFALTYINTARAEKVRGILLDEVIRRYYPYYGWVFVLHGGFAALGQYSCASDARASGAMCLLGMLICLTYALGMALQVVFSKNRREKLVVKYIKECLKKGDLCRAEQSRLVCSVGRQAAREFLEHDSPNHMDAMGDDSCHRLIPLLLELAGIEWEFTNTFPDTYEYIFMDAGQEEENGSVVLARPDDILFSLPAYKKSQREFQDSLLLFGEMWESVLSQVKEEHRQVRLVHEVLRIAAEKQMSTPAPCCGLIWYLHISRISGRDTTSKDGWEVCAKFLSRITRLIGMQAEDDPPEVQRRMQLQCRDMVITFLCLSLLEQAVTRRKINNAAFCILMVDEMNAYDGSDICICWSEEILRKYLCYALMVLKTLAVPDLNLPSRAEMYRIAPFVTQIVRQWLHGDRSFEKGSEDNGV